MNHVSVHNANVKHVVLNANSEFVCSTCNECLFDANHDMCVVNYLNDVNARARAKYKSIKNKEWKLTGKVFTTVGHIWLPTGRASTIVGNKCPLIRITSTKIVLLRKSVKTSVMTKTSPSIVSQWRPKDTTIVCSSGEPRIVVYKTYSNSEPNRNWGSIVSNSPSSSRV
ncbi:hypothetical protein Tco_1006139 [Tanacetum coccineum]|uniref:Uncharacterized protein n=1 Tax=Tanacetum coccineum TaxID=301880 RepID=A0ABQ5FH29_9ASTR